MSNIKKYLRTHWQGSNHWFVVLISYFSYQSFDSRTLKIIFSQLWKLHKTVLTVVSFLFFGTKHSKPFVVCFLLFSFCLILKNPKITKICLSSFFLLKPRKIKNPNWSFACFHFCIRKTLQNRKIMCFSLCSWRLLSMCEQLHLIATGYHSTMKMVLHL